MTQKEWQVVKVRFCEHAGTQVSLESEIVFPAEFMPDQMARVLHHRCSKGKECMLDQNFACVWSGGNPNYDPFNE